MTMRLGSHILFVDDEQSVLQGMKRLIRKRKPEWNTYFAQGVDSALEEMASRSFDTVVSDIKMPGRNGFELLEVIRNSPNYKDIPVVMVTGLGDRDLKRKSLEMGATDLLNKPVDNNELVARISSALQLKEYQDRIKAHNEILQNTVREKTLKLEDSRIDLIYRLATVGEYRDSDTGNHVIRVGYYCRTIAEFLGMDKHFSKLIFLTSPLHDIGKIGVPDAILLKQGRLSEYEFDIMRKHCDIGAKILAPGNEGRLLQGRIFGTTAMHDIDCKDNPFLEMASSIANFHHERWRGNGYPRQLSGTDIPIEARIVSIADAYDALHSERPYKPAYDEEKVLDIMDEMAVDHFDPEVYDVFLLCQNKFREIRTELVDHDPYNF
ncbi:MAG: response regulator [Desulfobulbaceae bacterium]|nr:response regulator [Desulfobulbaceae bacterium]